MRLLFISLFLVFTGSIYSQSSSDGTNGYSGIGLNSKLTYEMMEQNQNLRKVNTLLKAKDDLDKGIDLGFSFVGLIDFQKSNSNSKFGYLMRHPTANNQIGKTVSEVVIHSSQVCLIGSVNDWLTFYGEMLYNPQQSFGAGTITSLGRNQLQLSRGFALLGNTSKLPLYLALGKMDIPFGLTDSYSPFTNSTMWHAFGAVGNAAILGYKKDGVHVTASFIQGGSQFRALNSPVDSTSVPSRINNFALDFNYNFELLEDINLIAGVSYVKGSAYCQSFPVVHFQPCGENNPAYSYYGNLDVFGLLSIKASVAKTFQVWEGTENPFLPSGIFPASKVSSFDIGAKLLFLEDDDLSCTFSVEFSNFKAGAADAPWERQSQLVLGLNAQFHKTSRVFLEFFRTKGYVPLNFISGGNFPDPTITHSVRDARSFGIVVGTLLSI